MHYATWRADPMTREELAAELEFLARLLRTQRP